MRKLSFLSSLVVAVLTAAVATLPPVPPVSASTTAPVPNDPEWKRQWGPKHIHAPEAWTKTKGAGVIVAVIDSGVDIEHPDLAAKIDPRSQDYTNDGNKKGDDGPGRAHGHGTHVAGIAAAITDNSVGIAGVAPDATILSHRVLGKNEELTGLVSAINGAVDKGAKVINLSLGGIQGIELVGLIETPCAAAYQRGSLCVVASGNSGKGKPSGYDRGVQFLNVTAHNPDGSPSSFGQNADTQWSISAPGVGNYATYPVESGSYRELQGTSMAAPHAAGVAALLFAQNLTAAQVVKRMLDTAFPPNDAAKQGAGLLNAAGAVGAAIEGPAPTAPRTNTPGAAPSGGSRPKAGGTPIAPGVDAGDSDLDDLEAATGTSLVEGATGGDTEFDSFGEEAGEKSLASTSGERTAELDSETVTKGAAIVLLLIMFLWTLGAALGRGGGGPRPV